jgi:hypothetical protein
VYGKHRSKFIDDMSDHGSEMYKKTDNDGDMSRFDDMQSTGSYMRRHDDAGTVMERRTERMGTVYNKADTGFNIDNRGDAQKDA